MSRVGVVPVMHGAAIALGACTLAEQLRNSAGGVLRLLQAARRARTALPVLQTMLKVAGLAGAEIAADMEVELSGALDACGTVAAPPPGTKAEIDDASAALAILIARHDRLLRIAQRVACSSAPEDLRREAADLVRSATLGEMPGPKP